MGRFGEGQVSGVSRRPNSDRRFGEKKPILVVAQTLGLELEGRGARRRALCPVHEDTNPSLTVYVKGNSWYCFGCDAGGDVIALVEFVRHGKPGIGHHFVEAAELAMEPAAPETIEEAVASVAEYEVDDTTSPWEVLLFVESLLARERMSLQAALQVSMRSAALEDDDPYEVVSATMRRLDCFEFLPSEVPGMVETLQEGAESVRT